MPFMPLLPDINLFYTEKVRARIAHTHQTEVAD